MKAKDIETNKQPKQAPIPSLDTNQAPIAEVIKVTVPELKDQTVPAVRNPEPSVKPIPSPTLPIIKPNNLILKIPVSPQRIRFEAPSPIPFQAQTMGTVSRENSLPLVIKKDNGGPISTT